MDKTFEVKDMSGQLIGHYEAPDEFSARCDAMDETDIPADELTAEEI